MSACIFHDPKKWLRRARGGLACLSLLFLQSCATPKPASMGTKEILASLAANPDTLSTRQRRLAAELKGRADNLTPEEFDGICGILRRDDKRPDTAGFLLEALKEHASSNPAMAGRAEATFLGVLGSARDRVTADTAFDAFQSINTRSDEDRVANLGAAYSTCRHALVRVKIISAVDSLAKTAPSGAKAFTDMLIRNLEGETSVSVAVLTCGILAKAGREDTMDLLSRVSNQDEALLPYNPDGFASPGPGTVKIAARKALESLRMRKDHPEERHSTPWLVAIGQVMTRESGASQFRTDSLEDELVRAMERQVLSSTRTALAWEDRAHGKRAKDEPSSFPKMPVKPAAPLADLLLRLEIVHATVRIEGLDFARPPSEITRPEKGILGVKVVSTIHNPHDGGVIRAFETSTNLLFSVNENLLTLQGVDVLNGKFDDIPVAKALAGVAELIHRDLLAKVREFELIGSIPRMDWVSSVNSVSGEIMVRLIENHSPYRAGDRVTVRRRPRLVCNERGGLIGYEAGTSCGTMTCVRVLPGSAVFRTDPSYELPPLNALVYRDSTPFREVR